MSSLPVIDINSSEVGQVDVADSWLEREKGEQAVHQCVVAYLAHQRAGTASTKTRGKVRGGGAKPWRQKGTGRARAGSNRSPIWVGGGTTFGPQPRSYRQKVNKKVRKLALRRAFTDLLDQDAVKVVDKLELAEPRTSELRQIISGLSSSKKTLLVLPVGADFDTVKQAGRNLEYVTITDAASVNVYQLLGNGTVLILQDAVSTLGERLG